MSTLSLAGFARHRVLAVGVAFPSMLERLAPFFDVEIVVEPSPRERDTLVERLAGKSAPLDACELPIDASLLARLPFLTAICRVGSSTAGLDLAACTNARVLATNTADCGADEIARERMARLAADDLVAAFGFGRGAGHPRNLLNPELRCTLGCCL